MTTHAGLFDLSDRVAVVTDAARGLKPSAIGPFSRVMSRNRFFSLATKPTFQIASENFSPKSGGICQAGRLDLMARCGIDLPMRRKRIPRPRGVEALVFEDPYRQAWLALSPGERLRRSWRLRLRLKNSQAVHDAKTFLRPERRRIVERDP